MKIGFKLAAKMFLILSAACFWSYCACVALVFDKYGGGGCLADARRQGTHADYVWGLKWVPWKRTVLCGIPPPKQDLGSQDYFYLGGDGQKIPKPISPGRTWQFSHGSARVGFLSVPLPYFDLTTFEHYHFRFGWRWDDNDKFYTFSIALKKIPYDWEKLLFNWSRHQC